MSSNMGNEFAVEEESLVYTACIKVGEQFSIFLFPLMQLIWLFCFVSNSDCRAC